MHAVVLLDRLGDDRVVQLLERKPDAPLVRIHADHQQRQLVAHAHDLAGRRDRTVRHLRDVEQTVHAGLELDERAEVGQPHDLARDA
jgi:hypothetical protein